MYAKLGGAAALLVTFVCTSKALAMAKPGVSAPEIDAAAGISAMVLVAGLAAFLFHRNRQ